MAKIASNELTDASIQFIALVKHGAIREPFRIIKGGDTNMIDLGSLFRKGVEKKPSIGFVGVAKSVTLEVATKMVTDAGLDASAMTEQDTGYLFAQKGYVDGDAVVPLKISDTVFLGLKDAASIAKGFESYDWQSTDFKTMFATEGAMPMVSIACSALMDTIYNAMANSSEVSTAKADIDSAIGDFHQVVNQIVGNVPQTAFKLEDIVRKSDATPVVPAAQAEDTVMKTWETISKGLDLVEKAAKAIPPDPDAAADQANAEHDNALVALAAATAAAKTAAGKMKKGETEVVETATKDAASAGLTASATNEPGLAEDKKQKPAAGDGGPDPLKVTPTGDNGWATAHKELLDAIGKVAASVKEVAEKQEVQGTALTEVQTSTKKTAEDLKKMDETIGAGIIGGADQGDDRTLSTKSGEADDEEGWLVLDTAYREPFAKEAAALAKAKGR